MSEHEQKKEDFLRAYDAYADSIFRFCFFKTSHRDVALDLAQEVFVRLWQQLLREKQIHNVQSLLYTIARNLVIDWYRKRKSLSLDELIEGGEQFGVSAHTDIEHAAEAAEVLRVIEKLDDAYREVLLLRYVEDLPPREIAVILGESVNAVSVRINRATRKARELLERP
jgi:RNA polymerase sigma-70 factor (ECF subfamily)